jgi:hypothetical protein
VPDIIEGLQELRAANPEEDDIDTWMNLQGKSVIA